MSLRALVAQHSRAITALAGTLVLAGVLGYALFRRMVVRGLQAEAQLYLSYLQTLENAYGIEHHSFVPFDEFYGAPLAGKDHCQQPAGARELGFVLRWCHKQGQAPLRYAYRVSVSQGQEIKAFRAEAVSGSDEQGLSFVCFGDREDDVWNMDERRKLSRVKSCE